MKKIIISISIFFLKRELKHNTFFIGGHENRMVALNGRFLKDWQVEFVHKLKADGKIFFSHKDTIISTATGEKYTGDYYKMIK